MATTINGSTGVSQIQDDTVTTAKVDDSQITNALMADDAIGIAELSATGTASSSTFLRGDNAWAAPGGGGMTLLSTLNTTSGTTATTGTLDLTGYLQLVIWIYSVYPGTGSSVLRMGENGGTQLKIRDLVTSVNEPAYMQLNHNLSSGVFITLENGYGMGVNDTSEPRKTGATGIGINTAIDTATTALKFDLEGGQTFTGGSIKVYGLK